MMTKTTEIPIVSPPEIPTKESGIVHHTFPVKKENGMVIHSGKVEFKNDPARKDDWIIVDFDEQLGENESLYWSEEDGGSWSAGALFEKTWE